MLIKEAMFANYILFVTFCSMVTLVQRKKKHGVTVPGKLWNLTDY